MNTFPVFSVSKRFSLFRNAFLIPIHIHYVLLMNITSCEMYHRYIVLTTFPLLCYPSINFFTFFINFRTLMIYKILLFEFTFCKGSEILQKGLEKTLQKLFWHQMSKISMANSKLSWLYISAPLCSCQKCHRA